MPFRRSLDMTKSMRLLNLSRAPIHRIFGTFGFTKHLTNSLNYDAIDDSPPRLVQDLQRPRAFAPRPPQVGPFSKLSETPNFFSFSRSKTSTFLRGQEVDWKITFKCFAVLPQTVNNANRI